MSYSKRISDPAFTKYIANSNKWSFYFSLILAVSAITGFYIYDENSSEMDNPEAIYIGLSIASMFVLIAMFQIFFRSKSTTWDGVVFDKKKILKKRNIGLGDDKCWQEYMEFTVFIHNETGEVFKISGDNDDTLYNYYKIGDKVRHHKGLNSYEKYDKSNDSIIFCNACAHKNDIKDDHCFNCKCPLLK